MFVVVYQQIRRTPESIPSGINAVFVYPAGTSAVKDINSAGDDPGSYIGRHNDFRLIVINADQIVIFYAPDFGVGRADPDSMA